MSKEYRGRKTPQVIQHFEKEIRRLSDLFEFYLKEAYGYKKPKSEIDAAISMTGGLPAFIEGYEKGRKQAKRKININGMSPYVCGRCGIRMYYLSETTMRPYSSEDIQCVNACCEDYRKPYRPPTMRACDEP